MRHLTSLHRYYVRQPSFQVAFFVLALVTLACGFAGTASQPASDRATGLTPLPTLTRTRLPTFIPTTSSDLNSIANVAEPAGATPALAPAPVNTVAVPVDSDIGPTPAAAFVSTPASVSVPDTALPSTPTDTSTAIPTDTPTIAATETPQPTVTPTLQPTSTPTPTTVPPAVDYDNWSFANLHTETNGDALVIFGEVINNTGVTQELDVMGGLFYDDQGEVIADDRNMETNWSFEIVLPGERVSFEVVVDGIQEAADFELNVEAQPAEDS